MNATEAQARHEICSDVDAVRRQPSRFFDEKDTAADLLRAIIGHELETRPRQRNRRLLRVLVRDLRVRVAKPA